MIDTDYPNYVQWIKRHYGALIHIFWFIATETSDKGADIAARALALLAPLPNAVSVYNVSQQDLNFVWWQALAFALAMEFALFAIIEVALNMWDGVLSNPKRYTVPLVAAVIAASGVLAIVVSVVYNLEVKSSGNWILALLPFISMFSFIALGLKRWHERNQDAKTAQPRTTQKQRKSAKSAQPATQNAIDDAPVIALPSEVLQVWNMKQNGMTIAQIAVNQGKSERTINNRLKEARAHLNGHNVAEAA